MIAFDAKTTASVNPGTSLTWSHTCTGSNLILLVATNDNHTAADNITGITYNSVALTKIKNLYLSNKNIGLWYLLNPATGANNVVMTAGASSALMGIAGSYSGVAQTQPNIITGAVSATATASTGQTLTVTTTIDNSWAWLMTENDAGAPTAGTNATILQAPFGWSGAVGLFYNTNPISPTGNFSMSYTHASGNSWAVMAFFEPFIFSSTLTETLTIADTFIKFLQRTFTETHTISDAFSYLKIIIRDMTLETINLTDSLLRTIGKTLNETISIADTILRSIQRLFTETLSLSVIFSQVVKFGEGLIIGVVKYTNLIIGSRDKIIKGRNKDTDIGQGTGLR